MASLEIELGHNMLVKQSSKFCNSLANLFPLMLKTEREFEIKMIHFDEFCNSIFVNSNISIKKEVTITI